MKQQNTTNIKYTDEEVQNAMNASIWLGFASEQDLRKYILDKGLAHDFALWASEHQED